MQTLLNYLNSKPVSQLDYDELMELYPMIADEIETLNKAAKYIADGFRLEYKHYLIQKQMKPSSS